MVIVFSTDEIPVVMSGRGCGVSGVGQLLDWETHVNTPCSTGPLIVVMLPAYCLTLRNYAVVLVDVCGCMQFLC